MPRSNTPQVISVRPVTLSAPARGDDLEVRITAPVEGTELPVIVFAHGFAQSMNSYDPLVDHWTANGFVVVQPTFLDSAEFGLTPADPRYPEIWRTRVDDLELVIDQLETVIGAVPGLTGRADTRRLAVAGHSWGGQSVGMLLGARVVGADGRPGEDRTDKRVKAGVLLATTGIGGADLTPFAQQNFAFMSPDFEQLTTPSIVVAGDHDQSLLSTRGPDWFTDVYHLSPGAQHLVTLIGGEHSLGGIHAYGSASTTDESPERVELVRRTTTAFLQQALEVDPTAWSKVTAEPVGRIESK
ncbi:alpha/beta hydrolase family protein [Paractinoplanes lichenicola]|uniref:Alpha/beta hydrolase n=1 Tax=Paractinoplanes lichenicola TaxID=2802976 RepID=A0ABS1W0D3_9ACTN|nr:alpha/beta hydrolase [Actinoplanes lichenicola]MBL7260197.1 alpha/beta hydrolase [Actinoplanes lichenicola]